MQLINNEINNEQNSDLIIYSISSWYHDFKSFMVDTVLINIPNEVVDIFKDDELDILNMKDVPALNGMNSELEETIRHFGGTVFIKNNWHAPKDAAMFSLGHLLKVTNPKDALLYMSCSEIVSTDFEKNIGTFPFCMAVRKWTDLHPASEFRCIVVHKHLIAITPREWPKYYLHYVKDGDAILAQIKTFFENSVIRFPATHYIFDVVVTSPSNIILWDFGPLNEHTKLHAFSWQEIKNCIQDGPRDVNPVFRYIEDSTVNLQPLNNHPQLWRSDM